jgi:hypothetical protein
MPSSSAFVRNVSSSNPRRSRSLPRRAAYRARLKPDHLGKWIARWDLLFLGALCENPARRHAAMPSRPSNESCRAAVDRAASDGRHWPRLQLRRGPRRFAAQRPSPPRRRNDPSRLGPRAERDRKRRGLQIRPQLSLILPGLLTASRIGHRPLGK